MTRDEIEVEIRRLAQLAGEFQTGEKLIDAIDEVIYDSNKDGYYEGARWGNKL